VRLSPLGLLYFDGSSSCMSSWYVRCLVECCIYLYIAATFYNTFGNLISCVCVRLLANEALIRPPT